MQRFGKKLSVQFENLIGNDAFNDLTAIEN